MASAFIFKLDVSGETADGGKHFQERIPIYSFKSGSAAGRWPDGTTNLSVLEQITLGADGARVLAVSSADLYCLRALQNKKIYDFRLWVEDATFYPPFDINKPYVPTPRPIKATISCKDMNGSAMIKVGPDAQKMSTESINSAHLFAVELSFYDYDGGPVFTRT
jgi:hypothetical protein